MKRIMASINEILNLLSQEKNQDFGQEKQIIDNGLTAGSRKNVKTTTGATVEIPVELLQDPSPLAPERLNRVTIRKSPDW